MKEPRRWMYVLGLIVVTVAAGCGTESPTGPSFARTQAPVENAAADMPMGEDPGTIGGGTWTGEVEPDAVDRSTGKKSPKKPKNPNHANGRQDGDDEAPFERGN
jgi:hypothetical protein